MKTSTKLQLFLMLFLISAISISALYVNDKVVTITQKTYQDYAKQVQDKVALLIKNKQNGVLQISLTLSKSSDIKNAILKDDVHSINLEELSSLLKKYSTYKNMWFQIIDKEGVSFYRSWSSKKGDSLREIRPDVESMLKIPRVHSSISTGKFDITFKTMVPIYAGTTFIGSIESIAKFNSITKTLQRDSISSLLLVDKKYKKQLTHPFSKQFIDDYYVANTNASGKTIRYVREHGVKTFINVTYDYSIDTQNNTFIVYYPIKDIVGNTMGYFLLFVPLDSINLGDVLIIENQFYTFMFGAISLSFFLIVLIVLKRRDENTHYLQEQIEEKTALIKNQKEFLHYQANHDPLTKLPNRALFLDRLTHSIKKAKRSHTQFPLLFLDIDRFKEINDSLGHHIGDEILIIFSKRIQESIRESDTVARLGGDEFTIILHQITSIRDTIVLVEKLLRTLSQPIHIGENLLHVMSSIGIAIYPNDALNAADLLKNADAAMYKAKDISKGGFKFYTPDLTIEATRRLELENSIRNAIKKEEFILHYQPQINSLDDSLIGFEALVRWEKGNTLIGPNDFIPIAEATNLIIILGEYIIAKAFKQLAIWKEEGFQSVKLSINLSAQQINDEGLINFVLDTMKLYTIDTHSIVFEVTESYIMHEPEQAIIKLRKLKGLGFSISLDDFGTGYSSLSYLKKLPIDTLKIDKNFIDDIPQDNDNATITKSIIDLAKSMNLGIIAEGVEVEAQKEYLQKIGCNTIQGYYYSKPISPQLAKKFLKKS